MKTATRAGTKLLVRRIVTLVCMTNGRCIPRTRLATYWDVTPRTVSNIIERAYDLFKVEIKHVEHEGYTLVDPGLLSLKACSLWNCTRSTR